MAEESRQSTSKRKRAEAIMREHTRNRRIAFGLVMFLVVLVAFAGGFLLRSQTDFVASLGISVGSEAHTQADSAAPKSTYDAISERIGEVEDILKASSLDELELQDATNTMLTDLMKATGDPYAAYYDPERYESYVKESSSKKYSGIGVLFGEYDGRACAIDVFPGSEAEVKGVVQGDFVEAIDGDSHVWTMSEVVGALGKEDGSSVVITWMHPSSIDATKGKEFTTTLVCHKYNKENMSSSIIENDIGYIKLRQNTSNAASLVKKAVKDLSKEGAKAFILDIRDNPGGYLTQALDVASLFVQSGVLVEIQTVDGKSTRTSTGKVATQAPLVVLINKYTSASAEVLAAALADNQRATTVGQTTMGKGSVQVVRELTFGGAISYTVAYYLTPLGHDINNVGVSPEVSVANPKKPESAGADESSDMQLIYAIDQAHSLLEGN